MRDVRHDHPFGSYRTLKPAIGVETEGDVLARAKVRWQESMAAPDFITAMIGELAAGDTLIPCTRTRHERLSAAMVEGWRGENCHVAITNSGGAFVHYKVKDPSFHNWNGLALALSRSRIFHSAIKASTCPTAGLIYNRLHLEGINVYTF